MPSPNVNAISLRSVSKTYKLFKSPRQVVLHQFGIRDLFGKNRDPIPEFTALKDVSFDLRRGERIGLIGRNGAGKTTLLKLITGSLAPTSGQITVDGTVNALMSTGIGFSPEFTGRQNIDATLRYYNLHGEDYESALQDVIEFVELGKYLDQPFSTYSLGMQSRTQFAVATALRPDILLIDEVLGAGDGYFASKSEDRMKRLIGDGCTMILVSHSPDTIQQFCSRAIWLRNGSVHLDGDANTVLMEYENEMESLAQSGAGVRTETRQIADPFRLPNNLDTKFVRGQVSMAEPVDTSQASASVPVGADASATRGISGSGRLRIEQVQFEKIGSPEGGLALGNSILVQVKVVGTPSSRHSVRTSILVYTLSGERLAKVTGSSELELSGEGIAVLRAEIAPLLLGTGHYVVSALLEDSTLPHLSDEARHYLLSQCGALNVASENDSDPPKLHLDGIFQAPDKPFEKVRLKSVQ